MGSVYTPAEDSQLLEKWVDNLVFGIVLDMGTGSGIQAIAAAKKSEVKSVFAVDINPLALDVAIERARLTHLDDKIEFMQSDLFSSVEGSYDWIIFNPPYLMSEEGVSDNTWDGGKSGLEIIQRFLIKAKAYLKPDGSILMIYSSETGLPREYIEGYSVELLESKLLFFEEIYCVRLSIPKLES